MTLGSKASRVFTFYLYNPCRNGIIYAYTMSQAAAKQTFGECARTMMERSAIMV